MKSWPEPWRSIDRLILSAAVEILHPGRVPLSMLLSTAHCAVQVARGHSSVDPSFAQAFEAAEREQLATDEGFLLVSSAARALIAHVAGVLRADPRARAAGSL